MLAAEYQERAIVCHTQKEHTLLLHVQTWESFFAENETGPRRYYPAAIKLSHVPNRRATVRAQTALVSTQLLQVGPAFCLVIIHGPPARNFLSFRTCTSVSRLMTFLPRVSNPSLSNQLLTYGLARIRRPRHILSAHLMTPGQP